MFELLRPGLQKELLKKKFTIILIVLFFFSILAFVAHRGEKKGHIKSVLRNKIFPGGPPAETKDRQLRIKKNPYGFCFFCYNSFFHH